MSILKLIYDPDKTISSDSSDKISWSETTMRNDPRCNQQLFIFLGIVSREYCR